MIPRKSDGGSGCCVVRFNCYRYAIHTQLTEKTGNGKGDRPNERPFALEKCAEKKKTTNISMREKSALSVSSISC